jgi:hypothetical protein
MKKQSAKKGSRKKKATQVPVRSFSRLVRFALVMLPVGLVALVASFAFSMMPSYASAWSWHPHLPHFEDPLYEQCHNHLDDNHGDGIDLLDPACAQVTNASPEALNQDLTTQEGAATSTALTGQDDDDDILYFTISVLPQHGTLTCSGECSDEPLSSADVTYTPDPGFVGTDEFDFTASDGLLENDATITITVEAAPEPETPTCDEGYHLADNECVADEPPAPPVCGDAQHLEGDVCVDDPAPTPPADTPAPSADNTQNGGGGIVSGPLSIGFVNTAPAGGQVLGASTVASDDSLPAGCSALLDGYLRKGQSSDAVKRLQTFLNQELGLSIPITGYFGSQTFEAVKAFQLKYADEILKPWVPFGLQSDKTPTGYVYKTTQRMINLVQCSALDLPMPSLP